MFFGLDEVYVTKINAYIFVSDVSQKMIYVDLEASSPDQDFTHPYILIPLLIFQRYR